MALALVAVMASAGAPKTKRTKQQPKPAAEMNAFIDELMSRMTLEEKIGQLNLPVAGDIVTGQAKSSNVAAQIRQGHVGGLFNLKGVANIRDVQRIAVEESRLGIPLIFGMDVVHGYETVFPIPLGLSCTWDMEAIERSARIAALEATADGISWTFSPMVDICHDARWGRISEGSGEDPYLGSRIAEAMVRGYQQHDLSASNSIMACVKHFALYGAPEAGREYNTVDMSRWRMYNEYFPPYKAAFDAGAGSAMASFNIVDGIPATGSHWLQTEVLRWQWGFEGFVVTDFTGIAEMTPHGMGDLKQVSALALKAGIDMDMVSGGFEGTLTPSLHDGTVSQADIDTACRRILEAKYKLGLFDDPYRYCDLKRPARDIYNADSRAEARRIATESFVLLKNEGQLLPLQRSRRVALIGPLADTRANMPGTWSVAAASEKYRTLREAMTDAVGKQNLRYAKGCNLMYDAKSEADATMFGREMRDSRPVEEMLQEALQAAQWSDVIVFAGGESSEMSGECSARVSIDMPDAQRDLLEALLPTGKPIVLLNFSGRPMILNWESEHLPAILEVWFGGSETADAICDVVFGDISPSGKLTTSFPRHVGQLPMSYSYYNTGRPLEGSDFEKFRSCYMDVENTPLYPFGYGLSYTTFSYSQLHLSQPTMTETDTLRATVSVTNTGSCEGTEVVQLYLRDVVGSVVRPMKELKGFERITLRPGESREVSFAVTADMLRYYRPAQGPTPDGSGMEFVAEPGEFQLMVGTDSEHLQTATFTLTGPQRRSILAIGNSFSEDAVEQYLWEIAREKGYDLTIGNLYIGGCSLERHAMNVRHNTADYAYRKVVEGRKTDQSHYTIHGALADGPWDYVTLQQASPYSGQPQTYEPWLTELIDSVRHHTDARLLWHATWAYAQNSDHGGFANYNHSQQQMYDAISQTVATTVVPHEFSGIIPVGRAIQMARQTPLGDTLCRDGFHLNLLYGRYCAALVWAEKLLGLDARQVKWKPQGVTSAQANYVREVAHQAVSMGN